VYLIGEDQALVQTVDFFTPVVDDPEAFGAIAAANALSDVYAMGGQPLTALSIAAFPEKDFPHEWAAAIVQGGARKLKEAGCVLLGGHTVRDPEIKFGYAITGLVAPSRMMTNAHAQVGDVLIVTKPLGTGILATALKAGVAPAAAVAAATQGMTALNRDAAAAALRHSVRAATDITGFGLVGHASNIARESRVTLELCSADLPAYDEALALAARHSPGGLHANRRTYEPLCRFDRDPGPERRALLFDPQTSGGLLLCVRADAVQSLLADLPGAHAIGRVVPPADARIVLC
jgi:selenide,water dikinase